MPQNTVKTARKSRAAHRRPTPVARSPRISGVAGGRAVSRHALSAPRRKVTHESAEVVRRGRVDYVLLPVREYERLVKASMVKNAAAILETEKDPPWVDADDLALEIAGERIARARKAAGLTQQQLGQKLDLPQSQISRIERNPDRTTVRTLKRIADALGVDVSSLV